MIETTDPRELLANEAREHDRQYATVKPFGLPTLTFTPEAVWRICDYSFKRGTYRRGYRKRRLFQLMELDQIAGKNVLDVGCGTGEHTVLHALYGAHSHGFDISPIGVAAGARMAKANNVADLCHFAVASASNLPYKDNYFDFIVLNAVLHHLVKYPNVRAEIWRVLKPGGRLFVTDGLRDNPVYNALRWCYRKVTKGRPYAGDVDLSMEDLNQFLKGFELVYTERFALLQGLREGFARNYNNPLPIRVIDWLLFAIDQAIFRLWPVTRNYTSEFVMAAEKPAPGEG